MKTKDNFHFTIIVTLQSKSISLATSFTILCHISTIIFRWVMAINVSMRRYHQASHFLLMFSLARNLIMFSLSLSRSFASLERLCFIEYYITCVFSQFGRFKNYCRYKVIQKNSYFSCRLHILFYFVFSAMIKSVVFFCCIG